MLLNHTMPAIIRIIFFLLLVGTLGAQTTSISGVINTYAPVIAFDGRDGIRVESSSGFGVGDMVLLIQMQGAIVDRTSNDSSLYGRVLRYENAGNYETGIIRAVEGNIVRLEGGMRRSYDVGGRVQLVRVPRYQDVLIAGTVTAPRWDGRVGGVVALDAAGNVRFGANIDVSGAGFDSDIMLPGDVNQRNGLAYVRSGDAAMKGNGIAIRDAANEAGRGAFANGGGGGNAVNAGGGGGGNGGRGGKGGMQWDGSGSVDIGGRGGYALDYDVTTDKIFFGGSGGNGHQNNSVGSAGGRGGGIVILKACGGIIGDDYAIVANGISAASAGIDGAGGGGAGGTVMLWGAITTTLRVEARGGNGGSPDNGRRGVCHGTGGGGGGGVLRTVELLTITNIRLDLSGGRYGVASNPEAPCYQLSYGADSGDAGVHVNGLSRLDAGPDTTICPGDTLPLSLNTWPFATYQWSPATTLSCTTCANPVASPSTTTSYVVTATVCGFTRSDTVTVTVRPCGDTTSDLTYYLPTRCQGSTERVWLSFYNRVHTDSAVRISFRGARAADYSLDTALPFSLTPTQTIYFPVIHRWTTPGRNETILEMQTSSGITYRIRLIAITELAYTPVLDVTNLHFGEHATPFDTCFTVRNSYYTRLVMSDTAWITSGGRYRIVSPSLPIYIAPGGTATICMQVSELGPSSRGTLTFGGTVIDSCNIGRCVVQVIEIDSKKPLLATIGTGVDWCNNAISISIFASSKRTFLTAPMPNPAEGEAMIELGLTHPQTVSLELFDATGEPALALLRGVEFPAGISRVMFDVSTLDAGAYFCRMTTATGNVYVEKMVVRR